MKSRQWQFTINTEQHALVPTDPRPLFGANVVFWKFQLEAAPLTGRLHYQGCLRLKGPLALEGAKKSLGVVSAHMEPAKCWSSLVKYCGKEDSRIEGPWEHGEVGGQGQRSDLKKATDLLMAGATMASVIDECPETYVKYAKGLGMMRDALRPPIHRESLKVYCLAGTTGTGKTFTAHELCPDIYTVFCSRAPWFDGYNGESAILLDEMGPGQMDINFLKRFLDKYKMQLPIKGGSVAMRATTIFITTNYEMSQWYPKASDSDMHALRRRIEWVNFSDPGERECFRRNYVDKREAGATAALAAMHLSGGSAAAAAAAMAGPREAAVDVDALHTGPAPVVERVAKRGRSPRRGPIEGPETDVSEQESDLDIL